MLSDVIRLPHRLRRQGLWGLGPDVFIANLASLGLDPRTERSLREAIESYRRGVFLAASNLLGAAVEGAWYAAGQRLRTAAPRVDVLVDGDHTAQLQSAVAAALRDCLPGNRKWEADALSQFARLMSDIRNYDVHSQQVTYGGHRGLLQRGQVRAAVPRSPPSPQAPGRAHRPCLPAG